MNYLITTVIGTMSNPFGYVLDGHIYDGSNRRREFTKRLAALPRSEAKPIRAEFRDIQRSVNDIPPGARTTALMSVAARRLDDLYRKNDI